MSPAEYFANWQLFIYIGIALAFFLFGFFVGHNIGTTGEIE
jgi:hypothetical protein